MTLIHTSPPAVPPVTVTDAKAHLRVDGVDEDALIASLIDAATEHIERVHGLALISQGVTIVRDAWPEAGFLELPLFPVQEVVSVTTYEADGGGFAFDPGHYFADTASNPPRLVLHGTAPWPRPDRRANGIEIAVTAGFGDAPDDVPGPVRQALLLLVAHWFERREPALMDNVPPEVLASVSGLLAPHRMVRL